MQSVRVPRALVDLAVSDFRPRYKGVTRTMSAYTPAVTGTGPRAAVQRFGAFLAGMIMPNLGAFIAWGLITALTTPNRSRHPTERPGQPERAGVVRPRAQRVDGLLVDGEHRRRPDHRLPAADPDRLHR